MTLFQELVLFKRSDKVSAGILTKQEGGGGGVECEGLKGGYPQTRGHISNTRQGERLRGGPGAD